MKTKSAEDWSDFLQVIHELPTEGRMFRGVGSASYSLIPKVGRPEYVSQYSLKSEFALLEIFKQRATAHVRFPPENTMQWLALGQHHGLPTRLLDWSYSPLIAAFFAVENDDRKDDCAVYSRHLERSKWSQTNPFTIKKIEKYYPPHISARIPAQRAVFTVHPAPIHAMDDNKILKIVIPRHLRHAFKKHLHYYGFNRESLFPDLDGCCAHLTWSYRKNVGYWIENNRRAEN